MKRYGNEFARRKALCEVMARILPDQPLPTSVGLFNNDGQLSITLKNTILLRYIQEVRNEVGSNTSEPNVEVIRYYLKVVVFYG